MMVISKDVDLNQGLFNTFYFKLNIAAASIWIVLLHTNRCFMGSES